MFRCALSLFEVAAVAHSKDEYLLAVPFRRKEWQWRRLAHDYPAGKVIRCGFERLAIFLENRHGIVEGVDNKSRQYLWANRITGR